MACLTARLGVGPEERRRVVVLVLVGVERGPLIERGEPRVDDLAIRPAGEIGNRPNQAEELAGTTDLANLGLEIGSQQQSVPTTKTWKFGSRA